MPIAYIGFNAAVRGLSPLDCPAFKGRSVQSLGSANLCMEIILILHALPRLGLLCWFTTQGYLFSGPIWAPLPPTSIAALRRVSF